MSLPSILADSSMCPRTHIMIQLSLSNLVKRHAISTGIAKDTSNGEDLPDLVPVQALGATE
jgi:hypothetical protein